jgi:hypothetical protein
MLTEHGFRHLSRSETAVQNIINYLGNADFGSPRFQAFADCVDLQNAALLRIDGGIYNTPLILETIRQRTNSISGYKREYETVRFAR